ncbi:transposase mutator type, partial [Megasphaera sp. BL7]
DAQQILNNYDIKSAEDVQDVREADFWPILSPLLKGEMENHLGHKKHERSEDGDNVRNGYSSKTLKTSLGEVPIRVPRDRQSTFEPQIIKKHQRDVSSIEGKVLAMYARGMSNATSLQPSKTSTASRCHMNRSPPSQAASWKRSRHGGIVRSSRSIHLLSSTASTYRCARSMASSRWPSMSCLPMTSTAARMSLASGSTRRRASMPGCRSSTSCGLAALRILASCPWMA